MSTRSTSLGPAQNHIVARASTCSLPGNLHWNLLSRQISWPRRSSYSRTTVYSHSVTAYSYQMLVRVRTTLLFASGLNLQVMLKLNRSQTVCFSLSSISGLRTIHGCSQSFQLISWVKNTIDFVDTINIEVPHPCLFVYQAGSTRRQGSCGCCCCCCCCCFWPNMVTSEKMPNDGFG